MARIPDDFMARIKAGVDLVELGARHGVRWDRAAAKAPKACCPFHGEKTPSFVAHQDGKGGPHFHCYGSCGRSWDPVDFLMALGARDFVAAVEELAGLQGLTVPREGETPEQRREREHEAARRAQAAQALEAAQTYFAEALQARNAEALQARAYLAGRDLPHDGRDPFGFGYAPRRGAALERLAKQGIPREALALAGLVNEEGRPRFWARVTLPIRDRRGRVLSFAGRVLDGSEPKYLNGPDTPFFDKSRVLYGLDLAADAIRERGRALVVEGHLDRVTAHLFGLEHAVALQGTAFTPHHAAELARLAPVVVFALDADAPGRKALERALPVALEAGLSPRFVGLPDGEDPDGWLRKGGARG